MEGEFEDHNQDNSLQKEGKSDRFSMLHCFNELRRTENLQLVNDVSEYTFFARYGCRCGEAENSVPMSLLLRNKLFFNL